MHNKKKQSPVVMTELCDKQVIKKYYFALDIASR